MKKRDQLWEGGVASPISAADARAILLLVPPVPASRSGAAQASRPAASKRRSWLQGINAGKVSSTLPRAKSGNPQPGVPPSTAEVLLGTAS